MANYIFAGIVVLIVVFVIGFLVGKRHGQKLENKITTVKEAVELIKGVKK